MKIYIPSLSRADQIARGTVGEFPTKLMNRLRVVVPPAQMSEYCERLRDQIRDGLLVLPCSEKGIAKTRHWIGQYAASEGEDRFLMLDDDLGLLIRRGPGTWRLRGTTPKEVETMLEVIEYHLDTYPCVGVSPREGQNRLPAEQGLTSIVANTRIIRALAFRTVDFLACEHGRVPVMEDFDILLQLLRAGKPNALLTYFAQGQGQTQAEGGCSEYRTHDNHAAAAQRLAELHPNLVRLRWKKNKGGGAFGQRQEVTIRWKQAFAEGTRNGDQAPDGHDAAEPAGAAAAQEV